MHFFSLAVGLPKLPSELSIQRALPVGADGDGQVVQDPPPLQGHQPGAERPVRGRLH